MSSSGAPYHAHIYYEAAERAAGEALRARFGSDPAILFIGRMADGPLGPHPIPQFEIHFLEPAVPGVIAAIEASGLRALIHPLTDDDLADHTSLGRWIGGPVDLDLDTLDPPGVNQGMARFGKTDF